MKLVQEIYGQLGDPKRVVITMHQKPDADAMGSALALAHFLKQFGHSVKVVSPTNWARWLNWMEGAGDVLDYELNRMAADNILDQAEWLFCLDYNHFSRTKTMAPKLASLQCTKVLIDHHREPDAASFHFGISNTGKSSTCEMIYDFITGSGHRDKITKIISECLYAGVVADTGFQDQMRTANHRSTIANDRCFPLQILLSHQCTFCPQIRVWSNYGQAHP